MLLDRTTKMRFRFRILLLKKEKYSKVRLGIEVVRINSQNSSELLGGKLGLLLAQKLMCSLLMNRHLIGSRAST